MSEPRVFLVSASALNLRAGPRRSETVLAVLPQNQAVARLDETDFFGWWWVFADLREAGLFTGYVFAEHLTPAAATSAPLPDPDARIDSPPSDAAAPPAPADEPAPTEPGPDGSPEAQPPSPSEGASEDSAPPRGGVVVRDPETRHEEPMLPAAPWRPAPRHEDAGAALTLDAYLGEHVATCSGELTDAHRAHADDLLRRVNQLLAVMALDGVTLDRSSAPTGINSGWRPAAYNKALESQGAAKKSLHMSCQAIDLADATGAIKAWCMKNRSRLVEFGLYLEHPSATPRWCHLQSKPPGSGNRVFYP